jgi:hypothetical protein
MMDSFDEKRGMVKKLLAMLKDHASSEVDNGLKKPEGEGDMHGLEVSHVEVLPDHQMDETTPEHDIREEENQPHEEKMAAGGYVDAPAKKIPYESGDGQPDKEGAVHKEVLEGGPKRDALTTTEHEEPLDTEYPSAPEEPSSMFASFLGRKKRK